MKYEVKCKAGHVGRNNYIIVSFPVIAEDAKEAAKKARGIPRVKHSHKDAILEVKKISDEAFYELVEKNRNDGYLKCHSKQEQSSLDLSDRIYPEPLKTKKYRKKELSIHSSFHNKEVIRYAKKFNRSIYYEEKITDYIC